MRIESDFSETDETKPLVAGKRNKKSVMVTASNASNQSSSDVEEMRSVEKCCSHMPDEYKRMLVEALKCIDINMPSLITGGSSGSYFIHDNENRILGVFKPEDEEPYGINNPKWGKWFQKVFLPCLFGRGCLVPNQGYASEAAAYVVDSFFKFNIVPPTAVVGMASKVFNYSRFQRYEARAKQRIASQFPDLQTRFNWSKAYKKKKGSFQKFVYDYISPEEFLRLYPIETLTDAEKKNLTVEIHKMFTLDYIIRNTDRLNANYLIKVTESTPENDLILETKEAQETIIDISSEPNSSHSAQTLNRPATQAGENVDLQQSEALPASAASMTTRPESSNVHPANIQSHRSLSTLSQSTRVFSIACIDNGLAFPFKHPSDIRSYPFSWSKYFPYFANQPFAPEVKEIVLPILQNMTLVNQLCEQVKNQLNTNKRYQKRKIIKSQMSVFCGQMYNLLKALENNLTPAHLETKRPCYAKELKKKNKRSSNNHQSSQTTDTVHIEISSEGESSDSIGPKSANAELWRQNYSIKKHTKNPYFSCF